MPTQDDAGPADADWRRLGRWLWAGTGLTGPIGTVEHGWRYRAIDPDGVLLGRCRSLQEAQALLVHDAEAHGAVPVPWLILSRAA